LHRTNIALLWHKEVSQIWMGNWEIFETASVQRMEDSDLWEPVWNGKDLLSLAAKYTLSPKINVISKIRDGHTLVLLYAVKFLVAHKIKFSSLAQSW